MSCPKHLFHIIIAVLLCSFSPLVKAQPCTAPIISVSPTNQSTCDGGTVTFTVTASSAMGGTLGYQWQVFTGVWTNVPAPMGTTADLIYGPVTAMMNGTQVRVEVYESSNPACSSISNPATLNIASATSVSWQTGDQVLCLGDPLTLEVKVNGMANYSYIWYRDGVQVQSATNIINTSNIYSVGAVTATDAGIYYVEIISACSATPVASANVQVTVNGATISSVTSVPDPLNICSGGSADITVNATGNNLTYQWQVDEGMGFVDINGATNDLLQLTSIPITANGYVYRAEVRSNGGCLVTSSTSTMNVVAGTVITGLLPFGGSLCEGQQLQLGVFTSGNVVSYQWYRNNILIPGADQLFYTRNPTTLADAGVYTVMVQGDCGPPLTSDPITVTIIPQIDLTTVVSGSEVCVGSDGTVIISNSQSGISYQGFIGATAVSNVIPGNGGMAVMPITAALMSTGNNSISIQASSSCNTATLNNTATVLVIDNIGMITGLTRVCDNQLTGQTYSVASVAGASSYVWTADRGANITSGQSTTSITLDLGASPTMLTVAPVSAGGIECGAGSILIGQINSYSGIDALIVDEDTVCTGREITFTIQDPASVTYTWNIPSGTSVVSQTQTSCTLMMNNAADYTVTVDRYHQCNPALTPLIIDAVAILAPTAVAGTDQNLQGMQPATLDGTGTTQGLLYASVWSSNVSSSVINSPTSLMTSVTQMAAQADYTITVTSLNNASCSASDQTIITYERHLSIPNAFSPNADGIHDYFVIQNIQVFPQAILYVYNQWGDLIYKSPPGYGSPWDGTAGGTSVPVSAYYYVLELNEQGYAPVSGTINIIQ